jgi:hypothetical protein
MYYKGSEIVNILHHSALPVLCRNNTGSVTVSMFSKANYKTTPKP